MKITERVEGHYEVHETPFARAYNWHPASVTLLCECAEKVTLAGTSTICTCSGCGADYSAVTTDIQEREGRLHPEVNHPWIYDTQEQAEQHLRDEVAYPVGSPWRYNDNTTSRTGEQVVR
jgi:hypothetical protein